MKFTEQSCVSFVEALASNAPVPGGGGTAALTGAIGTALTEMVGSLTLGKKKYADVQEEITQLQAEAADLRDQLLALTEADAEAFAPLAKAYGLPKETAEEQAYKAQVMEVALQDACAVPMQIMTACCAAIRLTDRMSQIGTAIAVSDAGCAAAILRGALNSAALNVYINTRLMQERTKATIMEEQADRMLAEYVPLCEQIYQRVTARLRG